MLIDRRSPVRKRRVSHFWCAPPFAAIIFPAPALVGITNVPESLYTKLQNAMPMQRNMCLRYVRQPTQTITRYGCVRD
jgi:hypothetical protein